MPTDQLYSLYIGWDVDRKLFHQMLPSALLLKFEGTIRPISLIFKTFSSPNFALWVMVPCGPVHKNKKKCVVAKLESRKRNSWCVSVCLWNRQMRAVRTVISHRASDVSQCPRWGRQNADSTGNQFLNQISTIFSVGEVLSNVLWLTTD